MRLHRFYIKENLSTQENIFIQGTEQLHQWSSVFRYSVGDKVILFNGDGYDHTAEFVELNKKHAELRIIDTREGTKPSKEVHLYLATIKKDLFELVVEKATELGVSSITPIITERTKDKNLNVNRLEKIAIEASEQSFRSTVPHIHTAVSLEKALEQTKGYSVFLAQMRGQEKINVSSNIPQALFIGPEGGWGDKDLEIFKNHSVETISLGETILRAETAAIVGSFMLLK